MLLIGCEADRQTQSAGKNTAATAAANKQVSGHAGKLFRGQTSQVYAHGQGGGTPPTGCGADGKTREPPQESACTFPAAVLVL